jgi:hypothetical protein
VVGEACARHPSAACAHRPGCSSAGPAGCGAASAWACDQRVGRCHRAWTPVLRDLVCAAVPCVL